HTRSYGDWSSDVCSSDLLLRNRAGDRARVSGARTAVRDPCVVDLDLSGSGGQVGVRQQAARRDANDVAVARPQIAIGEGEPHRRSEERRVGKEWEAGERG